MMWNERYGEDGFAYGTEPNDFLKANAERLTTKGEVLCLAEGEGRNAVFLAQLGYAVTAVDQSSVGLRKAERLAQERGVTIKTEVADLSAYDLGENRWDAIVSISAHMPPAIRADLHRRVVDGLRAGGIMLLEAYTPRHIDMPGVGGPPATQTGLFMSLADLRTELAGLDFEHAVETERFISEGKYHQGESAVVQLIAHKPG